MRIDQCLLLSNFFFEGIPNVQKEIVTRNLKWAHIMCDILYFSPLPLDQVAIISL